LQEITLNVTGMTCAHCEKAVTNALQDLGVSKIKASAKKGTVNIVFSPENITLDAIKSEINEMGYHV